MLYEGFLNRLTHEFDEPDAASYLGPDSKGPQQYCIRATVTDMQQLHNVRCYNNDADAIMYHCPNWTGLGLLTSGYEGTSVEPFHSPWEKARKEISELAVKHSSLQILSQMQYLYNNSFPEWFGWKNDDRQGLSLYPSAYDPSHLHGASLTAAGRSHAQKLWIASKSQRVHSEVLIKKKNLPAHYDPSHTQIIAVVTDLSKKFVLSDAEHGAGILFASGCELQHRLLDAGLLEKESASGNKKQTFLSTRMSRVNAVLNNLAYVIVTADTRFFRAAARGPVCTCKWFCRYAGCEHVEYVAMLNLRLITAKTQAWESRRDPRHQT